MPPKSSNASKVEPLISERIRRFFGNSPAIGLEREEDFDDLYNTLVAEIGCHDTLETFLIRDIAEILFERKRLKDIRLAAIEKYLPEAAVKFLSQAYMQTFDVKEMEEYDILYALRDLFREASYGDQDSRKLLEDLVKASSVTNRMLQHDAYVKAHKTIIHLDDAIAKLEQRYLRAIQELQRRRQTLGGMKKGLLHAPDIVDVEDSSEVASKKDDAK